MKRTAWIGMLITTIALGYLVFAQSQLNREATKEDIGLIEDGCGISKPKGSCTPPSTYCQTTTIGDCQYYCVGNDGDTNGKWSDGVKCATGRNCNNQGLSGKCVIKKKEII